MVSQAAQVKNTFWAAAIVIIIWPHRTGNYVVTQQEDGSGQLQAAVNIIFL